MNRMWRVAMLVLIVIIIHYRLTPEYVPVLVGSAGWVVAARPRLILVSARQL